MTWKLSWFYPMKPSDTTPTRSRYLKVLDGRSQPIRGLWKTRKTGAFYAQLQIDGKTAWIPLPKAATRAQAVDELNKLKIILNQVIEKNVILIVMTQQS